MTSELWVSGCRKVPFYSKAFTLRLSSLSQISLIGMIGIFGGCLKIRYEPPRTAPVAQTTRP